MSINLERAFVLLSVFEKASDFPYIRGQIGFELKQMEDKCNKEAQERKAKEEEEKQRAEEAKLKVEEEKKAQPKTEPTPQVEKAAATEPAPANIERRV